MDRRRRAEVVELLRCAADLDMRREDRPFASLAITRAAMDLDVNGQVVDAALDAELAFLCMASQSVRHLRLLEVAVLVEEGVLP